MHDADTNVKPQELLTARNYSITNPYGASAVFDLRGVYVEENNNYGVYDTQTALYSYSPTGKLLSHRTTYAYSTGISGKKFVPYIDYTYDSAGNIISAYHGTVDNDLQLIFGASTYYEYDRNRVVKVQVDGATEKNTSASSNAMYEYYPDGKLKSITYPAFTDNTVLKTEYVYDDASRLTSLTNYKGTSVLSNYSYTYDSNGNILTTVETVGETQNSTAYTYDKLNRISTVSGTKGADSYYEYDSRGNRKANYEQIDFLSEENAEFRYDEEDHLYYANVGSNTTSFEYSSNGYRYVKRENTSYPEFYIYDEQGRLRAISKPVNLSMADGSTVTTMFPTVHYIWGSDRVLAKIDKLANQRYYYLYNGHYDVVQIVDTSGNIVNQYDYDVWGNFITKTETIDNHFTYFGQTYDETTGLYYLRARYYDPTTGRFTQQDPAEDGYNWYVYGNQNPVLYIDPTGENWIYNAWNWGEDAIWKGIAVGVSAYGWQLTADLLWLAASGSGHTFTAGEGSYASNLLKNDAGINKFINDVIWTYGASVGNKNPVIPTQSYEIPLSNGDLGAALHNVYIDINASQDSSGSWNATITVTDTFDFTEFKNPFTQGSVLRGLLWAANDVAYVDTVWGLLDSVGVSITYKKQY